MTDRALGMPAAESPQSWVRRRRSYWGGVTTRLSRDPVTLICAAILIAIVLVAIFAPFLGLEDPYKTSVIRRLKPPGTPGYPLGTDELGRDLLTRLIYGGRLSLPATSHAHTSPLALAGSIRAARLRACSLESSSLVGTLQVRGSAQ